MADSSEAQELQKETTDTPAKGRGRGRKRNPTKVVKQSKKPKKEDLLATTSDKPPVQQLPAQAAPQPLQTVQQSPLPGLQHSQAGLQPSQAIPQAPAQQVPSQASPQQPLQTVLQSPLSGSQHPQAGLQQPSQAIPQPPQTMSHPPLSGDNTSLPPFLQFAMPSNLFPSTVLNSMLQPSLQHAVPSSLTAPHASTMSLLSALNDDKLGLILPVLVRMEHKIDQLMAVVGAKFGSEVGNHLNVSMLGNQSQEPRKTQVTTAGTQKNSGAQAATTSAAAAAPPSKSSPANIQANARSTVAQLFDSSEDVSEEDVTAESEPSAEKSFDASKSLPGMSSRQRIQLEMAKITEKTLPDDLNFPISREDLIALQSRSTSTMNFAVRLLRELFSRNELIGRNIAGVRGKERVDPARIEIIKEIVFKVYRTSPSDRELLWRYCRKAMDSFLRKMQRPIEVVKDQYDSPSFAEV